MEAGRSSPNSEKSGGYSHWKASANATQAQSKRVTADHIFDLSHEIHHVQISEVATLIPCLKRPLNSVLGTLLRPDRPADIFGIKTTKPW